MLDSPRIHLISPVIKDSMIARERADVKNLEVETRTLSAGTYAAFKTECGGLAWEEFPKLFEMIFDSWLPASEYKQKYDLAIDVLHLWTDHDLRQKNRYYEVWIPVELKKQTQTYPTFLRNFGLCIDSYKKV